MKRTSKAAPASMKDVAEAAGVAVSTVSRALTKPGRVSKKTAALIQEAANRLDYTMNLQAQGLRLGKSRNIMVVLPERGTSLGVAHVVSSVLQGIDQELASYNYNILVANFSRSARGEASAVEIAYSGMVQGAIIVSGIPPQAGRRSLPASKISLVSVMRDLTSQKIPSILSSDRAATARLTKHLVDLGHRHFLYVSGPRGSYHDNERYGGILDTLTPVGLDRHLVRIEGDYSLESGAAAASHFSALSPRPTAVLCASDDMAIAFMTGVRARGVKVPEEVSISGFDGADVTAYCEPTLTTIKQATIKLGTTAAHLLMRLIDGEAATSLYHSLDPDLILRASTAGAPRTDAR